MPNLVKPMPWGKRSGAPFTIMYGNFVQLVKSCITSLLCTCEFSVIHSLIHTKLWIFTGNMQLQLF
jgi:hypothetical protein